MGHVQNEETRERRRERWHAAPEGEATGLSSVPPATGGEPRYDHETLVRVTRLAQQLQCCRQDTLSAREITEIGTEVGLDARFMQEAIARMEAPREQRPMVPVTLPRTDPGLLSAIAKAWWSAGWTIPFLLIRSTGPETFFLGWGIYIGLGVFLSTRLDALKGVQKPPVSPVLPERLPRAQLLETLFSLQRQLEGTRVRRTFLSIDVVGSTEMKVTGDALAVEYSFGQYRLWVEERIRKYGGQVQSAAGDGMMAAFADEHAALRSARGIQSELTGFNLQYNRLGTPFRVRCGLASGEVPWEEGAPLGHIQSPVLDRAARLQKQAEPGDIVVGKEIAGAALVELGALTPLPEPVLGETAFSWRASG